MSDESFLLDRVENPHPDMLEQATELREAAEATTWHPLNIPPELVSLFEAGMWEGSILTMCAATGLTREDVLKWMDKRTGRRPRMGHGTRACRMRGCDRPECVEANRVYMREYLKQWRQRP